MERDFLRKLRKERGISAQKVSEEIGINLQSVRRIESGRIKADFWMVKDYLSAIGYAVIVIDSSHLISAVNQSK